VALVWSARAKRDVRDIGLYIAQHDQTAAAAIVKRIVATADRLDEYPELGRLGRVNDTRELLVPGARYIVVYRIGRRNVRIVAVMHTSRKWLTTF